MASRLRPSALLVVVTSAVACAGAIVACSDSEGTPGVLAPVPEAGPDTAPPPPPPVVDAGADAPPANPMPGCSQDPGAPVITVDPASKVDPTGGAAKFTIEKALEGFASGTGVLTALITTEMGTIRCSLDETNAPISVANFVGLARGVRPYVDADFHWAVGRYYDGLVWHRVVPGFVIQGGDPNGDGTGGPGYDLVPENQIDEPLGTLAMAAGKKPSGSQFYVVVGNGPAPDYNVFGTCTVETAIAISKVPRDITNHPTTEVHIQRVDIGRCPTAVVVDGGVVDSGADADAEVDAGE